jgi:hypothetical protein
MAIQVPVLNESFTLLTPTGPAIQTATVIVGPLGPGNNNQVEVTATGIRTWESLFPGSATVAMNVFLQMGQKTKEDFGFPDQYALQYITQNTLGSNNLQITFRVMRVDVLYDSSPPPDAGWGQSLEVDILLFTTGVVLE